MTKEAKRVAISVTLDEELITKLDLLAEKLRRKRSDAVNLILTEAIRNIQLDPSGGTGFTFKGVN